MATTKPKSSPTSLIERQLLRSRSVLLFGPIESKLTKEVFTRLLMLDQMSKTKPIPVTTIVTGLAASAATIVMVGAPRERRLILPNSRVMLHQPSVGVQGTASDIAISAKEILRLRKKANELFVRETGQPLERLEGDMHRDYWMSAEECVAYGLVGKVVTTADEVDG